MTTLQAMGIEPVIVDWNPCGSTMGTFQLLVFGANTPAFWAERWELYRHQAWVLSFATNPGGAPPLRGAAAVPRSA